MDSGDYAKSESATDKLVADFSGDPNLPQTIYDIAEKYTSSERYTEAKRAYQQIMQNHPGSPFADKAKLSIPRADVLSLITSKDYDKAKDALDKMTVDFAGHKDLPEALYWIVIRYEWLGKFEEAKRVCKQIVQKWPDNSYANKAKITIPRANVISRLSAQDYTGAKDALNILVAGFSSHPDLAETLCWIGERYRWVSRFDDEKYVYQQAIEKCPGSPFVDKAKLGIARADAMSLVMSQDFSKAKAATDKMIDNFPDNPDLAQSLFWIAERYEWIEKYDSQRLVYQQIIQKCPESPYAGKAKLGIARINVLSLVVSQNHDAARAALDKMVADFKNHPDLSNAVLLTGEKYFRSKSIDGSMEKAAVVFKIITDELPVSAVTPEACCWMGDSLTEQGKYDAAIEYYKKACDGFPQYGCAPGLRSDYDYRWRSLFMTGQSYQKLKESGAIAEGQADPLIMASYERLAQEFGSCPLAKDACRELGYINAGKSQWPQTIRYLEAYMRQVSEDRCPADVFYDLARAYDGMGNRDLAIKNCNMFLKSTLPNDSRRREIKAILAKWGKES
jgi:TolA-binding protein